MLNKVLITNKYSLQDQSNLNCMTRLLLSSINNKTGLVHILIVRGTISHGLHSKNLAWSSIYQIIPKIFSMSNQACRGNNYLGSWNSTESMGVIKIPGQKLNVMVRAGLVLCQ
jgi:hypothetical protein